MMVYKADDRWYDNTDPNIPDYGNWYCTKNTDGTLTLRGDNDIAKLPLNIPYGSTAITKTGSNAYSFNLLGWEVM